jgi:hypothetical protein
MRRITWRANATLAALTVVAAVGVAATTVGDASAQNAPAPAAAPRVGFGPIGNGWKQVNPSKTIQVVSHGESHAHDWESTTHASEDGVAYDRSGGIEKFRLLSNKSNRTEVRVHNDYTKGLHQFEGELRVSSPTNDESCMQIFGNDGAGATTLMIRAYSRGGGTLRGGSKDLISGIYGKWVHINVIHDDGANTYWVYIDGNLAVKHNGPNGTHYFKYGVYGSLKTSSAQTEWRNVHFYDK